MSQLPQYGPSQPTPQQGVPSYPYTYAPSAAQGQAPQAPAGYAPQVPQGFSPQAHVAAPVGAAADSFFAALFDLSFTKFVTITFVKVIYSLGILVTAAIWLGFIVAGFNEDAGTGFAALFLGWIPALFTLLLMRLGVELTVATVRTAQNTAATAQNTAATAQNTAAMAGWAANGTV